MSTFARIDTVGGAPPLFIRPEVVLAVTNAADKATGQMAVGRSMLICAGFPGPMEVACSPAAVLEALKRAAMGIEADEPKPSLSIAGKLPKGGTIPKLSET